MTRYIVSIPYEGTYTCEVEADTPEMAVRKAERGEIIYGTEDDHAETAENLYDKSWAEEK